MLRLVTLNGLYDVNELWDFSYEYFKRLANEYIRMLSYRDWDANSQFKHYKIIFRDSNNDKRFLMCGNRLRY